MAVKILLVEDDTTLSEIYQARLQAEGYEILSAPDGETALAIAVKDHPDLIISDVMMPKISGFDMLDILRGTEGIKDTKVIMMSALGQAEDKARAEKYGADRYLVKSQVTLEDVIKVVQEVLSGQPAGSNVAELGEKPFANLTEAPAPATPSANPVPSNIPVATEPVPLPAGQPSAAPPAPTQQTAVSSEPPKPAEPPQPPVAAPPAAAMPAAVQPIASAPMPAPTATLATPTEPATTIEAPAESTKEEGEDVMKQIQDFVDQQEATQNPAASETAPNSPTEISPSQGPSIPVQASPAETEPHSPEPPIATPEPTPETKTPEPEPEEPAKQVSVVHQKVIQPPPADTTKKNITELAVSTESPEDLADLGLADPLAPHPPGSTITPPGQDQTTPNPSSISL